MGFCCQCIFVLVVSFLATLYLFDTAAFVTSYDLYGLEDERFTTWYFDSLPFKFDRGVIVFWTSFEKIKVANIVSYLP